MLEPSRQRGGRRVPPPGRLRPLRHRRHVLRRQRGPQGPGRRRRRRRAGPGPVRHAASRSWSTTTSRTVLWPMPTDNDDESWAHAAGGVGRRPRHARRLRRRRPPRPHVRRAVHDPLPRRLPPRPQARAARAGRADDHRRAGRSCSACTTAGVLAEGFHADLVVFDPETIGAEHATLVDDLPGGHAPSHRRRQRHRPRPRQRRRDRPRQRGHRRDPRHPPPRRRDTATVSTHH